MDRFDKIPYSDLSPEESWTNLGKGSFGCVYKGKYLGLEVAIKEILASGEYDVNKYLQREIKVMQEARHPNIVQYLGLCLAPASSASASSHTSPSNQRILIVSEFLPRGNLRTYIWDTRLPFPWRLRVSFCTDLARAVAYLHARQCLHRDLKGENALITENERIKLCDFGFARIAAQNAEEMRRLSYCGTDNYMSPEIVMGEEFGLPTDIFSLGVIFVEIITRTLADNSHFTRQLPAFGISETEIRSLVSAHCPTSFLTLTLSMLHTSPSQRPTIRSILTSLAFIEAEILSQEALGIGLSKQDTINLRKRTSNGKGSWNVGSVGFAGSTRGKRPTLGPKLPSFEGSVVVPSSATARGHARDTDESDEDDLAALRGVEVEVDLSVSPVLPRHAQEASDDGQESKYPTSVIRGSSIFTTSASSFLDNGLDDDDDDEGPDSTPMLRPVFYTHGHNHERLNSTASTLPTLPESWVSTHNNSLNGDSTVAVENDTGGQDSQFTVTPSVTNAVVNGEEPGSGHSPSSSWSSDEERQIPPVFHSALQSPPPRPLRDPPPPPPAALHRFSLVKPNFQKFILDRVGAAASSFTGSGGGGGSSGSRQNDLESGGGAGGKKGAQAGEDKCGVCERKVGWLKASLECDDCAFKCHIKCSDMCPPGCGSPLIPLPLLPDPPSKTTSYPSLTTATTTKKTKNPVALAPKVPPSKLLKKRPQSVSLGSSSLSKLIH